MLYMPDAKITAWLGGEDNDGIVGFSLTAKAFVDASCNGEAYLSFL